MEPTAVQLDEILDSIPIVEGYPRPDWNKVAEWVEAQCAKTDRDEVFTELARQWLNMVKPIAGKGFEIYESENFLLLTSAGDTKAFNLMGVAERALKEMLEGLPGVAEKNSHGNLVCLSFGDINSYYSYISHFIPDGEYGAQHLINVKRLAYETRPYLPDISAAATSSVAAANGRAAVSPGIVGDSSPAPAADLESEVASFLTRRGLLRQGADNPPVAGRHAVVSMKDGDSDTPTESAPTPPRGRPGTGSVARAERPKTPSVVGETGRPETPVDFVAEDDVRVAVKRGEKICIGPDTIITLLARELGEEHGVFRRN